MHCEGPGVADWFKESTITTRSLYSFNLLKCSYCSVERSLCLDCGFGKVWIHSAVVSEGLSFYKIIQIDGYHIQVLLDCRISENSARNYALLTFVF